MSPHFHCVKNNASQLLHYSNVSFSCHSLIHSFIHLSIFPSACLSVCLSVCLSTSICSTYSLYFCFFLDIYKHYIYNAIFRDSISYTALQSCFKSTVEISLVRRTRENSAELLKQICSACDK